MPYHKPRKQGHIQSPRSAIQDVQTSAWPYFGRLTTFVKKPGTKRAKGQRPLENRDHKHVFNGGELLNLRSSSGWVTLAIFCGHTESTPTNGAPLHSRGPGWPTMLLGFRRSSYLCPD